VNILSLYEEDGHHPRKASGKEHQGPCPGCGGNDRFCIYPEQGEGKAAGMGSFHCGHGSGGNGCGKGGDAITYLQEFRNLSFQQACGVLGIEAGRPPASTRARSPRAPKKQNMEYPSFDPKHISWPDIVKDPAVWQQHAEKFVRNCHEHLLARQKSLDYLAKRGISLAQVKKFQLGINLGETRNDVEWEPTFRPRKSWGMLQDKRYNKSRPQMFVLPAGLVIPCVNEHGMRRIRIRLAKQDPQNPKKKYHVVIGSAMDLWLTGADRSSFIVIETELDGIMIDGFCDKVGVLALGAVALKPDVAAADTLAQAHTILNALDFDLRKMLDEGRQKKEIERYLKTLDWWQDHYPQCKRWPVPLGKDPGEAYESGVDIDAWINAGLPAAYQLPNETNKTPGETIQEESETDTTENEAAPRGDELSLLINLVKESGGVVRIADQGFSVGFGCNDEWSAAYPEKRGKITWLLNSDGPAGEFVSALPDGNHNFLALRQVFEG